MDSLTFSPGPSPRQVRAADGKIHDIPAGWVCLPPGDAGMTRRVKALGPSWLVAEKVGRKLFSRGLWAPIENIGKAREALEAERSTDQYAKKRASDLKRREVAQEKYVADFEAEILEFLKFSNTYTALGYALAKVVTAHATPVGSGTVARTKRIEIDERAQAAVIAWMRHQTTAYDSLTVARVKGARREVRRELAEVSNRVLAMHRRDEAHAVGSCPLCSAFTSK